MDICPQPLWMIHRFIGSQKIQYPQKSFLPDIVDQLPGPQPVAQRQADRIAEMNNKMPLRLGVALAKPDQVLIVKGRLVQEFRILQPANRASHSVEQSGVTLELAPDAALPF